jgi:hypothetical protein
LSSERRLGSCLGLGALLLLGCADLERGERASDAAAAAPADAGDAGAAAGDGGAGSSFAREVHAMLIDGCRRCHTPGGMAASSGLLLAGDAARDRETVLAFVNREQPAQSRLLSKASGVGHGGGAVYAPGTPEYQTILRWITEGALP